ncbi:hypothetical protein H0H93_003335, partial [Arthromyces matolae]
LDNADWQTFLKIWVNFETKGQFNDQGCLISRKRPDMVREWIKRRRSIRYRPVTHTNVKEVEEAMVDWWSEILVEKGWRRTGINGVLSLVAGLFLWGADLQHRNAGWLALLSEVGEALQLPEAEKPKD